MDPAEIRKKRGAVRRSITNIGKQLDQLERLEDKSEVYFRAQRLSARVTVLDTEFKSLQYNLLSTIDETDEASIALEQGALDSHYENLDNQFLRIQKLLDTSSSSQDSHKALEELSHSLALLEKLKCLSSRTSQVAIASRFLNGYLFYSLEVDDVIF